MSHQDRAFDSALAYHQHVADGIDSVAGHRAAASLADDVAVAYDRLAETAEAASMAQAFTTAAGKARRTRDAHLAVAGLAAEITAIGERVSGR